MPALATEQTTDPARGIPRLDRELARRNAWLGWWVAGVIAAMLVLSYFIRFLFYYVLFAK